MAKPWAEFNAHFSANSFVRANLSPSALDQGLSGLQGEALRHRVSETLASLR